MLQGDVGLQPLQTCLGQSIVIAEIKVPVGTYLEPFLEYYNTVLTSLLHANLTVSLEP